MKLAILYTRLSGYFAACLEAYIGKTGAECLIIARPSSNDAPFEPKRFAHLGRILDRSTLGGRETEAEVRAFRPNCLLVSGWVDGAYTRTCCKLKGEGVPVISGLDNQWTASVRQRVASFLAAFHVRRFIDVLWVTGERQRQFAHRLGYVGERCWDGFYACDWHRFAGESRELAAPRKQFFLFVGRYVEEKGVRDLVEAYSVYRKQVENPWPLVSSGKGALKQLLMEAGADDRGFVQPSNLAALMHQASAFVLPSRFEPWGVVVQEAATCGLPLIVSEACGASVHLVRDGYNGFLIEERRAESLTSALLRMHRLSDVERQAFGKRSFDLSKQYTPERWAGTLRDGLRMLRGGIVGA